MSGLTLVQPRVPPVALTASRCTSGISFAAKAWCDLVRGFRSSYRPERHYMRGPGPRWREKHGTVSADHGRIRGLGRAETEGVFPKIQRHTAATQVAAAHSPERPAIAKRMDREPATVTAIDFRCGQTQARAGHTQAREIVEARRALMAELEQRRRVPWDWSHELREAA
jgi:hypothetical protein